MNTPINRDKVSAAVKLLTETLDDFDREMNDDIEAEDFNIGQDEQIELPTESFRTLLADHAAQAETIKSALAEVRRLSSALVDISVRVGTPGEIVNASQRGQALADVRSMVDAALDSPTPNTGEQSQ